VADDIPLACVIADAQWLDRASAQCLAFVARRVLAEIADEAGSGSLVALDLMTVFQSPNAFEGLPLDFRDDVWKHGE